MPKRSTAKASAARGRAKGRTATSVPVLHPNAAGIDIGSGSHFVAVAADRASQPVQAVVEESLFGVVTHKSLRLVKIHAG